MEILLVEIAQTFKAMSAQRLLIFGALALIVFGMLFGEIFAVFILHQNAGQQGATLVSAAQAVARQDPASASQAFASLGGLLEDRGTKVDTHAHMIGAGYLALMLALIQPYVGLAARTKLWLARVFVAAGVSFPIGIFTIHYIGLAYSPLPVIGWASVLADVSGFVLAIVILIELGAMLTRVGRASGQLDPTLPREKTWPRRALLSGGTLLVLLGFLAGARYAAQDLYRHEKMEGDILGGMLRNATMSHDAGIAQHAGEFGRLAGEHAVQIAAHSHFIEFGLLAILLSFIEPYVFLSETWRRRWVAVLLTGSLILPVAVALEVRFGLVAGGIADLGGLLVIIALTGMLAGVIRYSGTLDAVGGQR